jgi:hypothetical protein
MNMSTRSRPGESKREWLCEGVPEYMAYDIDLQGLDDEALGFLWAEDVQVVLYLHDGYDTARINLPAASAEDIAKSLETVGIMQEMLMDLRRDMLDRMTALKQEAEPDETDEGYCPGTNDHKHVIDVCGSADGDSGIVDVCCKVCGRSGSFAIDQKEVNW